MKTIIIYTTTNSCTGKTVRELSQKLTGEVLCLDLSHQHVPLLDEFDRIIIGGAIHGIQIQQRINSFCLTHMHVLRKKEIGLFICCSHEPETAREYIQNAFPEELHQMAKTEAIFKGALDLKGMSIVKRILVKRVALVRENYAELDYDGIDRFANRMEKTYHPFLFLV
jgi:menaquinone-dependent protoporphyrinogen oxidase